MHPLVAPYGFYALLDKLFPYGSLFQIHCFPEDGGGGGQESHAKGAGHASSRADELQLTANKYC